MINYFLLTPFKKLQSQHHEEAISSFLLGPDNTGNVVYLEIIETIFGALPIHPSELLKNSKRLLESNSLLLLPWANMLYPEFYSELIDIIVDLQIDVLPLSIGIQAHFGASPFSIGMSPSSLKLLQYVDSRGRTPGVRGEITQMVLAGHGFKAIPIGCPSCLLLPIDEIANSFSLIQNDRAENVRIGTNGTLSGFHRVETSALLSWAQKLSCAYVLQSESRIIADVYKARYGKDLWSPSMCSVETYKKDMENLLFDYGYYNQCPEEWGALRSFFMQKALLFFDSATWMNHIRDNLDIVIGSRFHGNVIAMLAGKPALFIPSDWRTYELCQFHSLPMIHLNSLPQPDGSFVTVSWDPDKMKKARSGAISSFTHFLEANSLPPINSLKTRLEPIC
jgi:hypothetical protein